MEVLLVRLHVSGQVSDAFGQDRNLHFRGTGIAGLAGEFFNERLLALGRDRHRMLLLLEIQHPNRSEEHTSELQSLMRISYAVFCLKKKKQKYTKYTIYTR